MPDDKKLSSYMTTNAAYISNLREVREKLRLTQKALSEATRAHDPAGQGVSVETISRMERRHGVSNLKANILADAINTGFNHKPPVAVLSLSDKPPSPSGLVEIE